MLPKLATTRQPFCRSRWIAAWISWLSPTVPPGLSMRSSSAGNSRRSTSRKALTTRSRVLDAIAPSMAIRASLRRDLRRQGQTIAAMCSGWILKRRPVGSRCW